MNKQKKKLLTRYTKRVLCELGIKYLTTQARHPKELEEVVKKHFRRHPGVAKKIFGFSDIYNSTLFAIEIRERCIDFIMRATREDEAE